MPPPAPASIPKPSASLPSYYTPPLSNLEADGPHDYRAKTWPKALGIIGIIFGFFGVCGGALAAIAIEFQRSIYSPDFIEDNYIPLKVAPLVGSVIAVLLLIGGILLLMRKPTSKTLILSWATAKIGYAVWYVFVTYEFTKQSIALQVSRQANSNIAGSAENFATVSLFLGAAW